MLRNSSSGSSFNSGDGPAAAASDTTTVLKKGPWTVAEDAILIECVQKHGEGNWNAVQRNCGLARCGKSCRLRWANHLRPNLKKGSFTNEEEMLILHLHAQLGNKWARMATQLPGRTDNEIKNFWNTRIKRRQRAGLPLYPSELQIQQQQRRMASIRPSPITVSSPSPSASPPQSPLPLFEQSLMHSSAMPVMFMPEGLSTFQFPVTSHHQMVSGPASMNNIFQYNYGNYCGEMNANVNNSAAMPPMYSSASVTTELPSSQLYNSGGGGGGGGGESGCGLLDALLQEAREVGDVMQRKMVMNNDPIGAVKDFGGDGDDGGGNGDVEDLFVESLSKLEESSRCSNGINVNRERPEEMSSMSTMHDDISKLFDMISTPGVPATPERYHATTDSCDISNGGQSSVATDDELGLELQHLASSLAPAADQDWNIGSCSWSNMPGIC